MQIKEIPKLYSVTTTTFNKIGTGKWFLREGQLAVKISATALFWVDNPAYILELSKSSIDILNMEIRPVEVELNYWLE